MTRLPVAWLIPDYVAIGIPDQSWNNRRMTVSFDELLAEGRAALRAGDAAGARRVFESAA